MYSPPGPPPPVGGGYYYDDFVAVTVPDLAFELNNDAYANIPDDPRTLDMLNGVAFEPVSLAPDYPGESSAFNATTGDALTLVHADVPYTDGAAFTAMLITKPDYLYADEFDNASVIMGKGDNWRLFAQSGSLKFWIDGSTYTLDGTIYTVGQIAQYMVRAEVGGDMDILKNGVVIATTSFGGAAIPNTNAASGTGGNDLSIGDRSGNTSQGFRGHYSKFAQWNRYLSDEEALALAEGAGF